MDSLELTDVLVYKSSLRGHRLDDDSVLLTSSRAHSVLSAAHMGSVAELVDGKRSVEEILEASGGRVPAPVALYLLEQLVGKGVLVRRMGEAPSPESAYWDELVLDGSRALRQLKATPVAIRAVVGASELADSLRRALEGRNVPLDRDAKSWVVVTRDYLEPELAQLHQRVREEGRPWCLVKPTGSRLMVGPWLEATEGPCWECLAFWLRNNRPVDELIARAGRSPQGGGGGLLVGTQGSIDTACGLAAEAIAQAIVSQSEGHQSPLRSKVLTWDFKSLESGFHAVARRPQCPCCGDDSQGKVAAQRPIRLAAVPKRFGVDGGYRQEPPELTFDRYRHLVSPLTGAVTYVTAVPQELDPLRPVFASSYFVCPRHDPGRERAFDKPCAGKGRTAAQARTSALCEALERFSGVYRGDEARVRASRSELGRPALCPEDLQNFSDRQYQSAQTNRASPSDTRRWIPKKLDPNAAIDWSPAWSITHNERRYVPLAYCYAEAPSECGGAFVGTCGNGVAAGNCLEEGILQGLLELVERDAAAVWWYNQLPRPGVDLHSFDDPWFSALHRDYASRGIEVWVLDLTHDLGITCCVAVGYHARSGNVHLGFGCHLAGRLAVQRALTELNQIFQLGDGGRLAPFNFPELDEASFLRPVSTRRAAAELSHTDGPDLRSDIEFCIARLAQAGLEASVVNKTRPDVGLHVAQVVVPGLRHIWPRFGPGRLYEVPCERGWRKEPLVEQQLNPLPLFL